VALSKYHIEAKSFWEPFYIDETKYSLDHLNAHEVTYKANTGAFTFIVTYSLHCFAKDDEIHSIDTKYSDGKETRQISLERYKASRYSKSIIENFGSNNQKFYETNKEKFFTIQMLNNLSNEVQSYKICFCTFKENRLLRMHITTAFFDTTNRVYNHARYSIFKIAMDATRRPKNKALPIEARKKSMTAPF
jgi:hypothetical protein